MRIWEMDIQSTPEFYASTYEGYIQIQPDEETRDLLIMEVVSPTGRSVTELTEGHLLMLADWLNRDHEKTTTNEEK